MTDEVLTLGEREVGRVWHARWQQARQTGGQALETVWRWLRNDWLFVICGCAVLIVAGSSYYLRQMPGQLADDPLAAARWLMTTSAEYGFTGDLLRSLGLFDLPRSPLLHLLLALIGLILFVRLGDQLAAILVVGDQYAAAAKLFGLACDGRQHVVGLVRLEFDDQHAQGFQHAPNQWYLRAQVSGHFAALNLVVAE